MKQFLVTMFIMVLIPSILKYSYLTNSFNSFKFKINLVPPSGFLTINIGETNSVASRVVSLIICLCKISSKVTWIPNSSSGEKLGIFALFYGNIIFKFNSIFFNHLQYKFIWCEFLPFLNMFSNFPSMKSFRSMF